MYTRKCISIVIGQFQCSLSQKEVQKSVTTEPIKFDVRKRECKFSKQNKQTWQVKFEGNCSQIWLGFFNKINLCI